MIDNIRTFFNFPTFIHKGWVKEYTIISLGTIILAVGLVLFQIPYNITAGGVTGLGIVVFDLTQGLFTNIPYFKEYNGAIPVGFFNFLINVPLFLIGIKLLGKKFGIKTFYSITLLSFAIDGIQYLTGLDPLGLKNDLLLASIYGGIIMGLGLGMIFKEHATSGGTDIIAMIITKFSKVVSIGHSVIIVDLFIIIIGLIVFKQWQLPLYSILSLWVSGKVIDIYMEGLNINKAVLVISNKNDVIEEKILFGLGRGGTLFDVKGMYSKEDKKLIFTVINRREVAILKDFIKDIDPEAFIVVVDAHETIGEGFKSIHEKIV